MNNMKFISKSLITALLLCCGLSVQARDYYASEFGAKADGRTLASASIQAAIDFASANGGGRVILTPGNYLTGTIYLKTGVTLHLEAGATLLGSLNPWDYVKDAYAGWTAMVFAIKQDNIGITGKGTIDCRGFEVANNLVQYVHRGIFDDDLKLDRPYEGNRPENIHFRECNNVVVSGINLKNPASWNQQYDQCRNLLIENINVDAKAYWNNDGLDVVDCSDVIVRNCYIDAADDAYCFKSHSVDGVSENILVENCVGRSSANGIKFGTFTRGVFKNFKFKNMTIFDTYRSAITIATVDGASVEDVEIDGLRSIHTGNPIFIRCGSRREGKVTPCLRNVVIKNVYAEVPLDKPDAGYNYEGPVEDLPRNVCASGIQGIPGIRVENVRLENVEIIYPGRTNVNYAYRGHSPEDLAAIPELEKSYPEFSNWKELPAWGFYIRHADGVEFKNVTLKVLEEDYRPAIVADDVNGLKLDGVKIIQKDAEGKEQIITNQCKEITITE